MKFLIRLISIIFLILSGLIILATLLINNEQVIHNVVSIVTNFFLKDVEIEGISFKNNTLFIEKITRLDGTLIRDVKFFPIERSFSVKSILIKNRNHEINYKFGFLYYIKSISVDEFESDDLKVSNFELRNRKNLIKIHFKSGKDDGYLEIGPSISFNNIPFKDILFSGKILLKNKYSLMDSDIEFSKITGNDLEIIDKCELKIMKESHVSCNLRYKSEGKIKFDGKLSKLDVTAEKLSIDLIKNFIKNKIFQNGFVEKLRLNIENHKIVNGYGKISDLSILLPEKVSEISGGFTIKDNFFELDSVGKISNSRIETVTSFDVFNISNLKISGKFLGMIQDAIDFLHLKMPLQVEAGKTSANFNISISAKEDISYRAEGSLSEVSAKYKDFIHFLGGGTFNFSNDKITGQLKGKLNGFDSSFSYDHQNSSKLKGKILLNSKSTDEKNFIKIKKGATTLDIEFDGKNWLLNSDLKKIGLEIPIVGLNKEYEKNAKLNASYDFNTLDLSLIGENIQIKLQSKNSDIIEIKSAKFNLNNFNGFIKNNDTFKVFIRGESIDISQNRLNESKNTVKKIDLDIQVKDVFLPNGKLENVDIRAICDKTKCSTLSATGNFASSFFTASLFESEIHFLSDNFGKLLSFSNLYSKLKKGIALVKIENQGLNSHVKGKFRMKNFSSSDVSFMTSMLSFLSLPGMLSTITRRNDISFDNFKCAFDKTDEYLKFAGSAEGPFFDFTTKGVLTYNNHILIMSGRVTPSLYFVSPFMKSIPFLGKIFVDKKRGLLTTPYKITTKVNV